MIYLDYAATTPMCEEALEAYVKTATEAFGNESSLHDEGVYAEDVLQACRLKLGQSINGNGEGIYFTNSGSEANILAVQSIIKGNCHKGKHIVTTQVEHASLHHLCQQLQMDGYEISYIPLNEQGIVTREALAKVIRDDTILVALHHGNPEIGLVQDVDEIGRFLADQSILFHVDAVQTYGEREIDVIQSHIDSLAVSAHKIYGPKGCGFAYINPALKWSPVYPGTTHEGGFRPGTVDVPAITAFTLAAHHIFIHQEERKEHFTALRQLLREELKTIDGFTIVESTQEEYQLPQIVGMLLHKIEGQYALLECNRRGIAISTGSACQVNEQDPSRSMLALGYTADQARQFIRISFGKDTKPSDIRAFAQAVKEIVKEREGTLVGE